MPKRARGGGRLPVWLAGLVACAGILFVGTFGLGPVGPPAARADDPAAAGAGKAPPAPEAGWVRFPGLRVHPRRRVIEVDAWFVIVDDVTRLEYLAVTTRGKMHESLLALECSPEKLQLALLLVGLEPKPEVRYQGEARALTGPRVSIDATFRLAKDKEPVTVPVESLLWDLLFGRPAKPVGFAFTGSRFPPRSQGRARLAAQATGNAISLYHDPDALLDNPRRTGGDLPLLVPTFQGVELVDWLAGDERFVPYAERLPDRGTECRLTIRPRAAGATPKRADRPKDADRPRSTPPPERSR